MNDNYTGMLARSAAGHDKGKIYVIIAADSAYVYLVDGKSRTLEKPKKKKQKKPVSRAVNNTPSVDKIRAGFTTGRAAFQLVPKPP